ncbi:sigma-54-dependent transcriptional regulator [Adhaeribacter terreus]|uniref:Sigma-54-dependent transcriptional regulator n=1 Tax=Adhaeribacter terreus TaxID=529703 RepID=A0ABW0E9T7_9BACT
MIRILLVEDDLTFSLILESFLQKQGFAVEVCHQLKDAEKALSLTKFNLLLLDYRLPDGTGQELLEKVRLQNPKLPVIIMTSFRDVRTAVQAMRSGAFDYITKPVIPDELLLVVRQALQKKNDTVSEAKTAEKPAFIKGYSPVSEQLHRYIELVAPTEMSVIIQGESGTGKENVARTIHALSQRSDAPFVAIDCGALSGELAASELFGHVKGAFTGALQDKKGLFETASGGTVFLDEVGNLSYEIQVKLLRALQERVIQPVGSTKTINVDFRLITATNDNLQQSVKNGTFREDLFHRLNEFSIKVPALRERGEDLQEFVQFFIAQANAELDRNVKNVSPEAAALLLHYDWPGNLRELKNVIKRAVLLSPSETLEKTALPADMEQELQTTKPSGPDLKAAQEFTEKELINKTLQEAKFNKSKAARLLNIDRKTLYLKMQKYGIDP